MHQSVRLVGSVVLCWSPLTSHVLVVYFSMVEVQNTSWELVGSSCWVMCDLSETKIGCNKTNYLLSGDRRSNCHIGCVTLCDKQAAMCVGGEDNNVVTDSQ